MPGMILDTQLEFRGAIPEDIQKTGIEGVATSYYNPYEARDSKTSQPLDNNALLRYLLRNSDIQVLLQTIGNAFFPRSVTVGPGVVQIIAQNRSPRGYILINPNTTVSGVTTSVTVFPAGTVFPVGVTDSASINVAGHGGAAFFMNTAAFAGTVTVDTLSQDPVTGNFMVSQSDIFMGGGPAGGDFYATVGPFGIDSVMRLRVTVTGAAMTGSIGATLKPALAGTVSGPTIFLGNADVNLATGLPLLSGERATYYLRENTPLFGIATAATDLRVFELQ